jgi:hypothetical protein
MASKVHNQSRIRRENQRFFVNGTEIFGVQSVNTAFNTNLQPIRHLGMDDEVKVFPVGEQVGQVDISSSFLTNDFFINHTGSAAINGVLLEDLAATGDNFAFTDAYLTNYSTSCSIGSIPEIHASYVVYGNMGNLEESDGILPALGSAQLSDGNFPLTIVGHDSIEITLSEKAGNRILSYGVDISVGRRPQYILGDRYPKTVKLNNPVEINCNFQMEIDEFDAYNMRDYPCTERVENIRIKLKDFRTDEVVQNFYFPTMLLVSQSRETSVNGNVLVNLGYRGFKNI